MSLLLSLAVSQAVYLEPIEVVAEIRSPVHIFVSRANLNSELELVLERDVVDLVVESIEEPVF
jgi:hypothetical protein